MQFYFLLIICNGSKLKLLSDKYMGNKPFKAAVIHKDDLYIVKNY